MVTIVSGLQVFASSSAEMKPATRRLSRRSPLQAGAAAALTAPALGFPFIRNGQGGGARAEQPREGATPRL